MKVELQINNSASPSARYVSWAPSPCRIRVTDPSGAVAPMVKIRLNSVSATSAGAIGFRAGTTGAFSSTLDLQVPKTGTSVPFFVAGKFGRPSVNNEDVKIEARATVLSPTAVLAGSIKLMVRIRKNAESLTPGERDRFVKAFADLNNQGAGRFADFRNMHTDVSSPQAHGAPGFLPWHRAYLLDLERELQAIDPSVALPYWRFDQPAPKLFTTDFLGTSGPSGAVQFGNTNPLQFWVTDGGQGVLRSPRNFWNPATQPGPTVITEAATLGLGTQYSAFLSMEGNPHGTAHTRWDGFIRQIGTAAKDPLFFLLHCNVDRLWAKWQKQNGRFDSSQASSFAGDPGNPIGHNLNDTMWPWNGITGGDRPPDAPGGAMASSPCASAPGPTPQVKSSLDYQGAVHAIAREGFDYDDVRFV
ncbi:MAG TPA: tyrosinase family protein [Pyrinomonadaceae bacterium]|nr:tyrosinase family protein [Pyrinomonadaceae bacterium]